MFIFLYFVLHGKKCTFKDATQNEMIAYQVTGGSSSRSVNCFTPLSYKKCNNNRQSGNNIAFCWMTFFLQIVKFECHVGNGENLPYR